MADKGKGCWASKQSSVHSGLQRSKQRMHRRTVKRHASDQQQQQADTNQRKVEPRVPALVERVRRARIVRLHKHRSTYQTNEELVEGGQLQQGRERRSTKRSNPALSCAASTPPAREQQQATSETTTERWWYRKDGAAQRQPAQKRHRQIGYAASTGIESGCVSRW